MNPKDEQHAFIVRVDGVMRRQISLHRGKLSRELKRRVSLAEAARHLFETALRVERTRNPERTLNQLGLGLAS